MGSRTQSHQLSNGLVVSGRPDQQLKERAPTMSSRAVPYTGGDIKKSGELGKMFDIPVDSSPAVANAKPSRPSSSSQHNSGSVRSGPNSGQLPKLSNSGSMTKKSSGPLPLQPTGLITSGPLGISSGGGERATSRRSGQLDGSGVPVAKRAIYGSAVTSLNEEVKFGLKISKAAMWAFGIVVVMGMLVGVFLMVAVKKVVILVAVAALLAPVVVAVSWSYAWGKRGIMGFVKKYPDAELRGAEDGQYVKVTGVVTCGSIPLETSFQRVPRCVYVSTELYEYKGLGGKSANPKHRCFTWGCRHSEKYVADFYISDFHSGLRALVKTGYGAKVSALVKPATVLDVTKEKREMSPNFLRWMADTKLSSDDRVMRLKEGYVKEGSTVSVMGVVRRHENVLMIVPPAEPISTGCWWLRCLLPMYVEGIILACDESQNSDVIAV